MGRVSSGGGAPKGTVWVSDTEIDASLAANLPSNPRDGQTHRISVAGTFENSASIYPQGTEFEEGDFFRYHRSIAKWTPFLANPDIIDEVYGASWSTDTLNGASRKYLYTKFNALDTEIGNMETALGLNADGTHSAQSGSNYLDSETTAKGERLVLDTVAGQALRIHPNGWEDNSKIATMSYNSTLRVFSILTTVGAAYWSNSTRYTPTAEVHTTSAHAATTGVWYCVYSGGTLTATLTPNFETDCIVAYAYYNATNPAMSVLFDERHPDTWPWSVHRTHHLEQGAKIVSGGVLSGYTLNTSTDAANTFAVSQATLDDESLRSVLDALADGGPYPVWNRSGLVANGEWSWDITPVVPYTATGSGPDWCDISGASAVVGSLSAVNHYVNYYLVGTNAWDNNGDNYKHRFVLVMGQTDHATLAAAQAESIADLSWGVLPFQEGSAIAKITLKRVATGTGVETALVTYLKTAGLSVIAGATPLSHSALSDRDAAGSHPSTAVSDTQSGTNYLDAITDVNAALTELDSKIKSESIKYAIALGG